jgi:hypothetical protein
MEQQILQLIEDEVERRVLERMTTALEKISRTYDISLQQLLRTASENTTSVWNGNVCHGLSKSSKQKCKRGVKDGSGYCHCHKDQKPVQRVIIPSRSQLSLMAPTPVHTHTLPPMFLVGCPACERGKNSRIDI